MTTTTKTKKATTKSTRKATPAKRKGSARSNTTKSNAMQAVQHHADIAGKGATIMKAQGESCAVHLAKWLKSKYKTRENVPNAKDVTTGLGLDYLPYWYYKFNTDTQTVQGERITFAEAKEQGFPLTEKDAKDNTKCKAKGWLFVRNPVNSLISKAKNVAFGEPEKEERWKFAQSKKGLAFENLDLLNQSDCRAVLRALRSTFGDDKFNDLVAQISAEQNDTAPV